MFKKHGDSIIHPPLGSNVPGKVCQNPYIYYPPGDLRILLTTVKDEGALEYIESALKQWERIYEYPSVYPWRKAVDNLRQVAALLYKRAEIVGPAQNVPYYQDAEVAEGAEGIIESLTGLYDNDNMVRFDIQRQGERPERDIDTGVGDFSAPHDPVFDAVKPRGDGEDPEGMDCPFPPTGGDLESWPERL